MVKQKRLSASVDNTERSLSDEVDVEQRAAKYLEENVDKTFENAQKSIKDVLKYLCIVNASSTYINAVSKVETLLEVVQEPIRDYIKQHIVDNTSKRTPQSRTTKITKKSRKTVLHTKSNSKIGNKLPKTKSSTKKMNEKTNSKHELDAMDETKYEISVINTNIENDRNLRRSQRVKYPPINRWAGEKLMDLHDGSFALIKSKTMVKPELVLANKNILNKLKKNKSRQKRLQTKKRNTLTISKRRQVSKNDKNTKTNRNVGSSKNRRRTLYSPTKWLDSLNSNSDALSPKSKQ